jgi:hypothetical protein
MQEGFVFNQSVRGVSNELGVPRQAGVPQRQHLFHYDDIAMLLNL